LWYLLTVLYSSLSCWSRIATFS